MNLGDPAGGCVGAGVRPAVYNTRLAYLGMQVAAKVESGVQADTLSDCEPGGWGAG